MARVQLRQPSGTVIQSRPAAAAQMKKRPAAAASVVKKRPSAAQKQISKKGPALKGAAQMLEIHLCEDGDPCIHLKEF